MDIDIIPADYELPVDRAYAINMVIKSFKGRKDVDVHLFRCKWDPEENEAYDWDALLGDPVDPYIEISIESSRRVLLEAFTVEERDAIVEYLKERYDDKLESITSCPLNFPIPLGLAGLSELSPGKSIGFIHFDTMPNYPLDFSFCGFFDLSGHKPIIENQD